jgi:hypothetical protein
MHGRSGGDANQLDKPMLLNSNEASNQKALPVECRPPDPRRRSRRLAPTLRSLTLKSVSETETNSHLSDSTSRFHLPRKAVTLSRMDNSADAYKPAEVAAMIVAAGVVKAEASEKALNDRVSRVVEDDAVHKAAQDRRYA